MMNNLVLNSNPSQQTLSAAPVRHHDGRVSAFDCDPSELDGVLGLRTIGNRNIRIDVVELCDRSLPASIEAASTVYRSETEADGPDSPADAIAPHSDRVSRMLEKLQKSDLASRSQAELILSLVEQQQSLWIEYPALRD